MGLVLLLWPGQLLVQCCPPVSSHISVVFLKAVGETVMAISVAYKVEKVGLRGVHGCLQ
jgi:hypothetical protein